MVAKPTYDACPSVPDQRSMNYLPDDLSPQDSTRQYRRQNASALRRTGAFVASAIIRCVHHGKKTWTYFDARDVARFWSFDKYTWFHWPWPPFVNEHICEYALTDLASRLAHLGFFQVHRKELVNLRFVRAVSADGQGARINLWDGQQVRCSRRRLAALRQALSPRTLKPLQLTPQIAPAANSPDHEMAL